MQNLPLKIYQKLVTSHLHCVAFVFLLNWIVTGFWRWEKRTIKKKKEIKGMRKTRDRKGLLSY